MSESSKSRGGWPHPANFLLGSGESRAAARAVLEQRDKSTKRDQLVVIVEHIGSECYEEPRIGEWIPQSDGSLSRVVIFHGEPDEETERRVLATP
jgi:hypothetical protein